VAASSSVLQRFPLCPIESNGNENFKVIQNAGFLPYHPQNWITGNLCHSRHTLKISERSVHNFLSYLADTQTDRQTDKVWQKHYLLGGGNNILSFQQFPLSQKKLNFEKHLLWPLKYGFFGKKEKHLNFYWDILIFRGGSRELNFTAPQIQIQPADFARLINFYIIVITTVGLQWTCCSKYAVNIAGIVICLWQLKGHHNVREMSQMWDVRCQGSCSTVTGDWNEFVHAASQVKGSVVDHNGRLRPADQIIRLNGQDVLTAKREQIAQLLKVSVQHASALLIYWNLCALLEVFFFNFCVCCFLVNWLLTMTNRFIWLNVLSRLNLSITAKKSFIFLTFDFHRESLSEE